MVNIGETEKKQTPVAEDVDHYHGIYALHLNDVIETKYHVSSFPALSVLLPISFKYHSHTSRDSGMGVV